MDKWLEVTTAMQEELSTFLRECPPDLLQDFEYNQLPNLSGRVGRLKNDIFIQSKRLLDGKIET